MTDGEDSRRAILLRRARFLTAAAATVAGCSPSSSKNASPPTAIVVDNPTPEAVGSTDAPDAQPPEREKREKPEAVAEEEADAGTMRVVVASSCLMYVLQQLLFAKKSSAITQDATTLLDETAEVLKKQSDVRVRIEGHTDDTEPKKLGQTRAEEVRKELIQRGIDASRLTAANAGKSKPLMRGKSAEDRARNRRVEFYIEP